MSSIVNKIKDAIHSDKSHEQPEGTHGPHGSRVANAADPRVDSDRDHRANPGTTLGSHGTTGAYSTGENYTTSAGGPAPHTAGPHKSDMLNKTDPRIDSDRDGRFAGNTAGAHSTGGTAEGVHGPHSSRVANALDPRVDSDRDGSRTAGNQYGTTGTAGTTGAHGMTGTHGTTGMTGTHGTTGMTGTHGTTGLTGTHGTTGMTGTHGTTGLTGTHGTAEGVHGPHSSRAANALDPRVDSDRDGSHTAGNQYGATGTHGVTGSHGTHGTTGLTGTHGTTGMTGTHGVAGTHGTHSTTGMTGTHGTTGMTGAHGVGSGLASGPGPAPNTAGPHKSDIVNKIDPRVDSDLDGSKTVGRDQTYGA